MIELLLATKNSHKTREFRDLLGVEFRLRDLNSEAGFPATAETGITFAENAVIKALAASRKLKGLVVADDSGLEVDALDGAPGIFSARYAGLRATDSENVEKLLRSISRVALPPPFHARFRCALAAAENERLLFACDGCIDGSISLEHKGKNGFGYDPVFMPEGFQNTFAELPPEVKNQISHRARAAEVLVKWLTKFSAASL